MIFDVQIANWEVISCFSFQMLQVAGKNTSELRQVVETLSPNKLVRILVNKQVKKNSQVIPTTSRGPRGLKTDINIVIYRF